LKWNLNNENILNCDDASQSDEITENISFKDKEESKNAENLVASNIRNFENQVFSIRVDKLIEGVKEEYNQY
jgi:hypothetical protein